MTVAPSKFFPSTSGKAISSKFSAVSLASTNSRNSKDKRIFIQIEASLFHDHVKKSDRKRIFSDGIAGDSYAFFERLIDTNLISSRAAFVAAFSVLSLDAIPSKEGDSSTASIMWITPLEQLRLAVLIVASFT